MTNAALMDLPPRIRRLVVEHERVLEEYYEHPFVNIVARPGTAPDQYDVSYRISGARWDEERNRPVRAEGHQVRITLPASYPRQEPFCVVTSGAFHPNIGSKHGVADYICLGDVWTPTQELWQIIGKIGEMLQYRIYNVTSPLNAKAARWALDNPEILPLGNIDIYQRSIDITIDDQPESLPGTGSGARRVGGRP